MFGLVVGAERCCEVQKREKKNSYLAFLDISKGYECGKRGTVWDSAIGVEE